MSKRFQQLDGLRFVAITMIFIAHWIQQSVENSFFQEIPFIHGVTLFFVLSGYLITDSLLKNRDSKKSKLGILKVFYIRRTLRIFPAYYLLLLILFVLNFESTRELAWWLFSYSTNIYQSINNIHIDHLNHMWSLSVEEQFYLLWPLIILSAKWKNLPFVIIFTIVLSLCTKGFLFVFYDKWMATAYFTLSCSHALALGALLSYLIIEKHRILTLLSSGKIILSLSVIYVLIIVFGVNSNFPWYKEIFDEFIFSILSFCIISRAVLVSFKSTIKWILENKVVLYLGKISYGLYLIHLITPVIVSYTAEYFSYSIESKSLMLVLYLMVTIGLASISWYLVEKPILNKKKLFQY